MEVQGVPVLFGKAENIGQYVRHGDVVVVTDDGVPQQHVDAVRAFFPESYLITLPQGEQTKTRETKSHIEDELLGWQFGRNTALIALGGGMVLDLAGFLAATYCRGIDLINIPTTLLAMVDAAIGGKTAVNTPQGKNMVGVLYHPQAVLIDPSYLATLPERHLRSGMVEVIKHALITDKALFEEIDNGLEKALQERVVDSWIRRSIEIKKEIVEQDPDERLGIRRALNFGHTYGHAYEAASNYRLLHGEAVALGILEAVVLSQEVCGLPGGQAQRIERLICRCCPHLSDVSFSSETVESYLRQDKKAHNGQPRFVLIESIGQVADFFDTVKKG